ncbi:MAG: PKD domain-containing protein [Bacteroides sp.]|jgi:PKD repeat protein|nr:PKD domain-containing protein [Bacteroides sp.]
MNPKNFVKIFLALGSLALFIVACDKEEEKVWGEVTTYFTIQDADNLFAPATVQFINGSKNAEAFHWTFPGGRIVSNGEVTEDSTSTAIQPEGVYYAWPGEYSATLKITADGEETTHTKQFAVVKPQPNILYEPTGIVYDDIVTFWVEYFQYPQLMDQVTYAWDFGNGETSTEAMPQTSFNPPGDYTVTLELFDGMETLTASKTINVQAEIAKTLYVTNAIDQRLYKKMLYTGAVAPEEELPVDVGLHPLSVSIFQERIIVSVAGDNIRFSAAGTPPDGYIFTTNLQGGNRYTITSPSLLEQTYIDDPFVSTVDENGFVYWLDRFQGVRRIHYSETNGEYPSPYVWAVAAEMAEILGVSSTYGWTDGTVRIENNEIWYSKHGTGQGLYRFTLLGAFIAKIDNLYPLKIRTFEVDNENQKIYFAVNNASGGYDPGLYVCEIDGSNIQLIDDLEGFSMQGGEAERTYVTSIVVDSEGGYIYYPFRHQDDVNTAGEIVGDGSLSGVKRYKMDGSEEPEFYVTGLIPYGIGIDHVKR